MLNFVPNNWYVYIIRNNKTNWLYIGLHHQVGNKPYSNSSSSVLLQEAIDAGDTSEYIVWKGKNSEKAAALETYLINLAKSNMRKIYNKNSGGGHKGGARPSVLTPEDYYIGENIILHEIYPKSVSSDDEEKINANLRKVAVHVRDAVKDMFDKKSNPHKVHYESIDWLMNLPFLQIRENAVDKDNVDKVVESMLVDMTKAEYLVEPVSIIKFKNGNLLRVDGTSTTYAAKEINKWKTKSLSNLS
jgi:predicted GIY-YIG superfamily endonuclease